MYHQYKGFRKNCQTGNDKQITGAKGEAFETGFYRTVNHDILLAE